MSIKSNIIKYRRYFALIVVDALFFGLFSPDADSFIVIPAFLLVIVTIYMTIDLVLRGWMRLLPLKKTVRQWITFIFTGGLSLIIALQSIGQLTTRDVITIVPLIALLYFYLAYNRGVASGR